MCAGFSPGLQLGPLVFEFLIEATHGPVDGVLLRETRQVFAQSGELAGDDPDLPLHRPGLQPPGVLKRFQLGDELAAMLNAFSFLCKTFSFLFFI